MYPKKRSNDQAAKTNDTWYKGDNSLLEHFLSMTNESRIWSGISHKNKLSIRKALPPITSSFGFAKGIVIFHEEEPDQQQYLIRILLLNNLAFPTNCSLKTTNGISQCQDGQYGLAAERIWNTFEKAKQEGH